MTASHHLTAHWVDEDEGADATLIHHHLVERWVYEDEGPVSPLETAASKTGS
jgi:hypothetical protein